MGCSTSSQTSAVDTTRPSAKPEESNGASATGVASENDLGAEDSETIQEVTSADATAADEPAIAATSVSSTSAAAPAGEEAEPAAASPSAEADSEAPTADSSPETETSSPEHHAEATAADPEPQTVEATDPSE
ncbi:hypothetical protein Q5P01_018351 [Channa striata]|uniref:Uncharacterized protein n=1 Tax=Channa striata TaxID=64152 RepID=A0AA88S826_CHASR|nr:hypothetical protein Q5P01_018351 [Channa striata]